MLLFAVGAMLLSLACNKNIDTKFEDQINDTVRGLPLIGNDTGLNVQAVRSIMDQEGVCRGVMAWNLEDGSIHRFRAQTVEPAETTEERNARLKEQAHDAGKVGADLPGVVQHVAAGHERHRGHPPPTMIAGRPDRILVH